MPASLNDHAVMEGVTELLLQGRVKLSTRAAVPPRVADEEPPPELVAQAGPEEEGEPLTWIRFRVPSNSAGIPLANISLRVLLTDGREVERTTNADGVVYIDGIPGGTCSAQRMDDARALTVVRVESA